MKAAFIHTIKQVPSLLKLPKEEHKKLRELLKRHPMRIPPYYFDLIDFEDEQDPIAKMAIPSLEELSQKGEWDTSGEKSNTRFSGLQHKYKQQRELSSFASKLMAPRTCGMENGIHPPLGLQVKMVLQVA